MTQSVRQRFGYMPEERGLYPKMQVAEQITWLGQLHGLSRPTRKANTARLLEQLELTDRPNDKLEALSLGNQQRVQIAAALVHDPDAADPRRAVLRPGPDRGRHRARRAARAGRRRRAGAVLQPPARGGRAALRRPGDHLRRRDRGERRAARSCAPSTAPPRFELVVDSDAGWLRDHPGIRVVDLDGPRAVFDLTATARGRTRRSCAPRCSAGGVRSFAPVVPTLDEIFKEVI